MDFILVVIGLLTSVAGAVVMLRSEIGGSRRLWRHASALAVVGIGLVVVGGVILPFRNQFAGIGSGGVLLLVLLIVAALVLNAAGMAIIISNGLTVSAPIDTGEAWLERAQRRTRIGVAIIAVGLAVQLAGIAIIAR